MRTHAEASEPNLRLLRENAGLTQADLAVQLGISQPQVARYEKAPDDVPWRIVRKWIEACGEPANIPPFDPGDPLAGLRQGIAAIELYVRGEPPLDTGDTVGTPYSLGVYVAPLSSRLRKPRIALYGRFDAGKSRLANALLGQEGLPSRYSPTTLLPCLVLHRDDKPYLRHEDVWIMPKGADVEHVLAGGPGLEPLVVGDLGTLNRFGTSDAVLASRSLDDAGYALVFLDAPILRSCEILDTPGFGSAIRETPGLTAADRDEWMRFPIAHRNEAVCYLAPFTGFMNGDDMRELGALISRLPGADRPSAQDRLRHLIIIATHAHPNIRDDELRHGLDQAAARIARELAPQLAQIAGDVEEPPTAELVRARIFPWYVETPSRRLALESDLRDFLTSHVPAALTAELNRSLEAFFAGADEFYPREIQHVDALIGAQATARGELERVHELEPCRKDETDQRRRVVEAATAECRALTRAYLDENAAPRLTSDAIKKVIDETFIGEDARKRAEEGAGAAVLAAVRADIEGFIAEQVQKIEREVDLFIGSFNAGPHSFGRGRPAFDAQAAFLGGLAGATTFGALAAWAATTAGGNLGAWLLVPQVVSLLARLGIGVAGGTAGGVSIVAALGGPVGIGIGLALSIGLIIWQVMRSRWQDLLAEGLASEFAKRDVLGTLRQRCDRFWQDTTEAFARAADETEKQHREYLDKLNADAALPREALLARRDRLEQRRQFLRFVPRRVSGGKSPAMKTHTTTDK
ncbi:MAG: helix-turn-helix domain-containing protein [Hyphomicrobiales bacterium]|nr:helix-turn-helix domain-containing protein [Hyphomicrobiales bacterium]